jgi:hypothetical protein
VATAPTNWSTFVRFGVPSGGLETPVSATSLAANDTVPERVVRFVPRTLVALAAAKRLH